MFARTKHPLLTNDHSIKPHPIPSIVAVDSYKESPSVPPVLLPGYQVGISFVQPPKADEATMEAVYRLLCEKIEEEATSVGSLLARPLDGEEETPHEP